MNKIRIAIIGIHGIPAKYGGFETLAEYLSEYLSGDFEITVFCSKVRNDIRLKSYKGSNLVYVPFDASGWQSVIYDVVSILKAGNHYDKILILGVSGGIVLPVLKKWKNKFVLNIGGLDWKRSKWNYFAKKFLKFSEKLAVKSSGTLVSDNQGILDYLMNEYGRESNLIFYGGDHVSNVKSGNADLEKYPFLKGQYAFSVARIQHDNNIEMILNAFTGNGSMPIVFVGNWNSSRYGKSLRKKYSGLKKIHLLDPVYDKRELNVLRSNCLFYIHGHSAGGTNPSLVEAMTLALPVIAYKCDFNIYTTGNNALYFSSSEYLEGIINITDFERFKEIGEKMKAIAQKNFIWEVVAGKYSEIFK